MAHTTHLDLKELMVDTAGASYLVFGLFWLLGYKFSPRMADLGARPLYRFDMEADYGELGKVATGRINEALILENADEVLRLAASIKSLTIKPSEAIRALSGKSMQKVAAAIKEIGKIEQAFYTLSVIDDPQYRRRTLTQLNRTEGRHVLGRAIFHGKRGKIYKHYREGQEDQLGVLGLVLNAVVLWNTLYIQRIFDTLEVQGMVISDDDKARVSPLITEHITFEGRYLFEQEQFGKKEFRQLRDAGTLHA